MCHLRRIMFVTLSFVFLVCCGCSEQEPAGAQPRTLPVVIEPESLPEMTMDASHRGYLIRLDCRARADYEAGHLPGAVHVDLQSWRRESLDEERLDDAERWAARFAELGIGPDDRVIIYDDGNMTDASRVWFLLQFFGVSDAGIVNGGWPEIAALIVDGRLEVSTEPVTITKRPTAPADADRAPAAGLARREEVKKAVETRSSVILDVRTQCEYAGTDDLPTARHGHLPGAINVPHAWLLEGYDPDGPEPAPAKPSGRIKPPEALRELFEQAGLPDDRPIVTHCQSGGRSSLGVIALIHAGYGDVANYYPSFADWAADMEAPVVEPDAATITPAD